MVPEPGRTCLGLEFFCSVGDELWQRSDSELIELATRELADLKIARDTKVVDGKVVRVPKAYPVYDSTFRERLVVIRQFLAQLTNFHTIGRNGMHKYNNQDHSMMAALMAVRTTQGQTADAWDIETELDYLEDQRSESQGGRDTYPVATIQPSGVAQA